jgi:hypothetical protein
MIEQLTDCVDCLLHLASNFYVIQEACASVGIEHGLSTDEELSIYVAWYHANNHQSEIKKTPSSR